MIVFKKKAKKGGLRNFPLQFALERMSFPNCSTQHQKIRVSLALQI